MRRNLGIVIAVLAMTCALLAGSASFGRAEEPPCTTQGALALALADVLGIKVTEAQAAADALAALGVKPQDGWKVDECLTERVRIEIAQAYAGLNRDAEGFNRALGMLLRIPDQQYPRKGDPVSRFTP
jgi:hypothetical protein